MRSSAREGLRLAELPPGRRVATGSPRRKAQVQSHRADLVCVPVRGNVDTRLRKLEKGEFDALVLATGGLVRLGMAARDHGAPSAVSLSPRAGAGGLALQVREEDRDLQELVGRLDHPASRAAVTAERAFLEALGGGCAVPVGALGEVEGERLLLREFLSDAAGARVFTGQEEGSAAEPEAVGRALAARPLARGARTILEALSMIARGTVYLVGAGPGDPGLITRRGLEILRAADVVIYDRLVSSELLLEARRRPG